jgi:transcriptional regulator with XRE-family HTH domain
VDERIREQLLDLLASYEGKQDALAAALHVDKSTVSRWLNSRTSPQPRHEDVIADHHSRRLAAAVTNAIDELERGADADDDE